MEKFNNLKSIPVHMPLLNIDTDMIIPKQFLKTIKRTGLGINLFDAQWPSLINIKNFIGVMNTPILKEVSMVHPDSPWGLLFHLIFFDFGSGFVPRNAQ